ncbi:MAG: sulfite exporter TauE/SafE family protein [Methanobacteriota archaeon]|nr:MAG: sulfite exporter TauE/SafE family protein [Euryarchaeota archaeon]
MEQDIVFFILVGFIAQAIDGALGMAYGVSSMSMLLTIGIPPAAASASVHASKVFTNLASGISHWSFGNVDWALVKKLCLPGMIGGVIGALLLTTISEEVIRPFVSVYLIVMAIIIFRKVVLKKGNTEAHTHLFPLGLAGGFFDALGGGGWGPIVTSTLLARGNNPRFTVGSVNTAEFFVALIQSATFILTIGLVHWQIILGLIIGGVISAPMAAMLVKKIPAQFLMNIIGIIIAFLGLRMIYLTLR